MAKWIDVGPVSDFPNGAQVCTAVEGKPIVLFNIDGEFYAIANECPHAGLPIGEGERAGMVITCPFHGYAYHIKTGRNIDWPHDEPPARTYPVRVEGDTVQIEMQNPGQPANPDEPEDEEPKRSPAPSETPDDENEGCDDQQDPECPTGYPARKPTEEGPTQ